MKLALYACCVGPALAFVARPPASSSLTGARATSTQLDARKPLIAGNWKENPCTVQEAEALASEVAEATKQAGDVGVVVIPPYPFLVPVQNAASGALMIGGQNCYFEEKGAYTGAVSTAMLSSVGCTYVLCGHSERRTVFRNDDNAINRKLRAVLDHNMMPILCIGESKEEYDAGLNKAVCAIQLSKDLKGVTGEEMKRIVVAYEPVWAIGTGLTATPEIAQSVHDYIRGYLAKMYSREVADEVIIQYGGSVTPDSVDALMAMPDIDGALVGGASLDGAKFGRIINYKKA
eukprot:TRINITY_DN6489_c0_g1_i1.p1 TRINITY_DN6489_c0_g1~~TRINITY_DN6489_c0_g1_i1.p1  ORF type:complete len:306 (-),score=91.76 TRINITY_DN6489_c0_g1_i1:120-989(-)